MTVKRLTVEVKDAIIVGICNTGFRKDDCGSDGDFKVVVPIIRQLSLNLTHVCAGKLISPYG